MVATMSSSVSVDAGDRLTGVQAQLLVDLVAAHPGQVVALLLEEQVLQQGLRGLLGRRLARAQLAVDVQQRLVGACGVVLLQRRHHDLGEAEPLGDLLGGPAQRLEQHGDRLTALAVDAHTDGVALVDVELEPRAAAGDHLDAVQRLVGGLVAGLVEVDTRRPDELGHDDTLGAVDDERALLGHHREVAHEHRLALDLAGVVVDELGRDEQRSRVRHVLVFALVDRGLDLVESRVGERQRHRSGEVLDRRQLGQHLFEATDGVDVAAGGGDLTPALGADQPFEGLGLHLEQPRNLERLTELGERNSVGCSGYGARGSSSGLALAGDCQDASFQHLMRLSGWSTPPLRRELCVGSAGVLPIQTAPNNGHATRSLSRNGAQPRTTVSEAVDGQEAASATSNNSAGRRIPQPWRAGSTRALAGVLNPCTHAAQQTGPSDPFRQEITACFRRRFPPMTWFPEYRVRRWRS